MVDLGAEFAHIIIDVSIKLLNEDVVEDVVWAMVMAYSDEDKDGFDLVEFKEALDAVKADLAMSFQNPTGGVREFPDLFDSWRELATEAGCRDEGVEKWWGEILAQYSLPQRTCPTCPDPDSSQTILPLPLADTVGATQIERKPNRPSLNSQSHPNPRLTRPPPGTTT